MEPPEDATQATTDTTVAPDTTSEPAQDSNAEPVVDPTSDAAKEAAAKAVNNSVPDVSDDFVLAPDLVAEVFGDASDSSQDMADMIGVTIDAPDTEKDITPAKEADATTTAPVTDTAPTDGDTTLVQPVDVTSAEPVQSADTALLNARIAGLEETINSLQTTQQPQQQTPTQPAGTQATQAEIPDYTYAIPATLIEGIMSDDAQQVKATLANFAQGISRTVHQQLSEENRASLQQFEGRLPQIAQEQVMHFNQSRAVFDDFYKNYETLNNQALYPIVRRVAEAIMAKTPGRVWDKGLRDEVAAGVFSLYPGLKTATAAVADQVNGVKKAPAVITPGAAPTDVVSKSLDPNGPDAMVDMLRTEF